VLDGVERRFRALQGMLCSCLERLQTKLITRQRDRKYKEIKRNRRAAKEGMWETPQGHRWRQRVEKNC
jgi:hypothetical protein